MEVGNLQSRIETPDASEPFYFCSIAMMEAGQMTRAFVDGNTDNMKDFSANVAVLLLESATAADVELEDELETVESYKNIDTETILFKLFSDLSDLGYVLYDDNEQVEDKHFLNCMRDMVALQESIDMNLEKRVKELT